MRKQVTLTLDVPEPMEDARVVRLIEWALNTGGFVINDRNFNSSVESVQSLAANFSLIDIQSIEVSN